jgi:SpoVK/Ycf46/Vps4 family AAA+-type ATPase
MSSHQVTYNFHTDNLRGAPPSVINWAKSVYDQKLPFAVVRACLKTVAAASKTAATQTKGVGFAKPDGPSGEQVRAYVLEELKAAAASQTAPSERKWVELRYREKNLRLPAMDAIIAMTGLARVKRGALDIVSSVVIDRKRSLAARTTKGAAYNFVFTGNPGTGKTTVARLLGKLLAELELRPTPGEFVEVTGQTLLSAGQLKFDDTLKKATPGVLFIDEAYQLEPASNTDGAAIVNKLLAATEASRTQLTVIVAGYKEDIEAKFLAANSGLPSRFPFTLHFEDFDAPQLRTIFSSRIRDNSWQLEPCEPGCRDTAAIAAMRLARGANKRGFANARSVRVFVEAAFARANVRFSTALAAGTPLSSAALQTLTRADVLGAPIDVEASPEIARLMRMTGLADVKKAVLAAVEMIAVNYRAELRGDQPIDISLNRLFLGNPGTGKVRVRRCSRARTLSDTIRLIIRLLPPHPQTSVAKLYGSILKQLALLSVGDVEVVTASQLTGAAVGATADVVNKVLDRAKGKVLIVDEAYMLAGTQYGREALDVLVERVQGTPGDDMAVILCGYDEEMKKMLRECNAGLASRFRVEDAFNFADYSDAELEIILQDLAKDEGVYLSPEAARGVVANVLSKQRSKPNFGNARAARNVLQAGKERRMRRLERGSEPERHEKRLILLEEDLFSPPPPPGSARRALKTLVNADHILAHVDELEKRVKKAQGRATASEPFNGAEFLKNYRFVGPPGTGKTTVARAFGEVFVGLGLLSDANLVEVQASDLIAQYVGQTAPIVNAKMKEALGGVLFIDEACA